MYMYCYFHNAHSIYWHVVTIRYVPVANLIRDCQSLPIHCKRFMLLGEDTFLPEEFRGKQTSLLEMLEFAKEHTSSEATPGITN